MSRNFMNWTLYMYLLNNSWVKEKIKTILAEYLENIDNEKATYKKYWDVAKVVLSGKLITLNICIS